MRNLVLQATGIGEAFANQLTPVAFRPGETVKHEGDVLESFYFPVSGLISARSLLQDGRALECSLVGRTSVVGAVAAMGVPCLGVRCVCLSESRGYALSVGALRPWLQARPGVEHLMKLFCFAQVGYAVHVGVCNAMHAADQRVARWLSNASDLLGHGDISISQEELAITLGLQRSSLSLALHALKAEGVIALGRGRILVADSARLRRRACECAERLSELLHLTGAETYEALSACETAA